MGFVDRADAGRRLGSRLAHLRGEDPVLLALPRGGVPVAFEVARALDAPLDVIVVRKLGVPLQPELAMGAIGEGGVVVINDEVLRVAGITTEDLARVQADEQVELAMRGRRFRGDRPALTIAGRTVIIIDDGMATGSSARAACEVVRVRGGSRIILAVPVAPPSAIAELRRVADEIVCLETHDWFEAVGQWYDDFSQTTDEQCVSLLERAGRLTITPAADDLSSGRAGNGDSSS